MFQEKIKVLGNILW